MDAKPAVRKTRGSPLAVFSVISPHFRPRRHRLTADDYRTEMTRRFAVWNEVTGLTAAA